MKKEQIVSLANNLSKPADGEQRTVTVTRWTREALVAAVDEKGTRLDPAFLDDVLTHAAHRFPKAIATGLLTAIKPGLSFSDDLATQMRPTSAPGKRGPQSKAGVVGQSFVLPAYPSNLPPGKTLETADKADLDKMIFRSNFGLPYGNRGIVIHWINDGVAIVVAHKEPNATAKIDGKPAGDALRATNDAATYAGKLGVAPVKAVVVDAPAPEAPAPAPATSTKRRAT